MAILFQRPPRRFSELISSLNRKDGDIPPRSETDNPSIAYSSLNRKRQDWLASLSSEVPIDEFPRYLLLGDETLENEYCEVIRTTQKTFSCPSFAIWDRTQISETSFLDSTRDIHLSVTIEKLPSFDLLSRLGNSESFQIQHQEETKLRVSVASFHGKEIFYRLINLIGELCSPSHLQTNDIFVLANTFYLTVHKDLSYLKTNKKFKLISNLISELSPSLYLHETKFQQIRSSFILLCRQLAFFDPQFLQFRLNCSKVLRADLKEKIKKFVHTHFANKTKLQNNPLHEEDLLSRRELLEVEKWIGSLNLNPAIKIKDDQRTTHHLGIVEIQGEGNDNVVLSLQWLFELCQTIVKDSNLEPLGLMSQIIELMQEGSLSDSSALRSELLDLIGYHQIDQVPLLVQHQEQILSEFKLRSEQVTASDVIQSIQKRSPVQYEPNLGKQITVRSDRSIQQDKRDRKILKKAKLKGALAPSEFIEGGTEVLLLLQRIAFANVTDVKSNEGTEKTTKDQLIDLLMKGRHVSTGDPLDGVGLKRALPEGTKRSVKDKVETFEIPAVKQRDSLFYAIPSLKFDESMLVPLSYLPAWSHVAFPSVKRFNLVQSTVLKSAFEKRENILVSAPTGAGKTNIALLTIMQQINDHMTGSGVESAKTFKIVYIAPMKSLVAEITDKYSKSLKPLGIEVQELTADMQLTRKQIETVHLIVTVPEKWDILTRSSMTAGISSDTSLMSALTPFDGRRFIRPCGVQLSCLIIDEVHLLNDSRGPVLESIVARTLRYMEACQKRIRIVGLSATLPNWMDVALFLRVDAENVFHFDGSYRPVPLQQTFIGIEEKDPMRRFKKFNDICFEKVLSAVTEGHQVMVFVHSRGETKAVADALLEIARIQNKSNLFKQSNLVLRSRFEPLVRKAKDQHLKRLFEWCFGIHHAGMMRSDRSLTERMFLDGALKVLCCTATLAWGVNLPARCVIVKGTNIFDSKAGGFRDVSILDVLQIFGRAGRPQFDNVGQAILMTTADKLSMYLNSLTHQTPIESQFMSNIANALNAEICLGTISNETDACIWLAYTYFFVRIFRTPQVYGVPLEQLSSDPELFGYRRLVISKAADCLDEARLTRINRTDFSYYPTLLGRIAAKFYLDWETARTFRVSLSQELDDPHLLRIFGQAAEFEGLKVRPEEIDELMMLAKTRHFPFIFPIGDLDSIESKVSILLQTYLNRVTLETSSLVSDTFYIQQNAPRLMRAMFEMSLAMSTTSDGNGFMTERLLEWCKMIERRIWSTQHVLRHFCYAAVFSETTATTDTRDQVGTIKEWTVKLFEDKKLDYWRLKEMTISELSGLIKVPREAHNVYKYLRRVPNLHLHLKIQPITNSIIRLNLTITPDFEWCDRCHGQSEVFRVWVEDPEAQSILHSEDFVLTKKKRFDPSVVSCTIPLGQDRPTQYLLKVISEKWVGVSFQEEFSIKHFLLPDRYQTHTPLLDLHPLPIEALKNSRLQQLYKFTHFNPIQTQVFHTLYHTSFNVLLGAPTGSGKTIVAELAAFALFRDHPHQKVVYIAPMKALAKERIIDWKKRFGTQLGKSVTELTGDFTPDIRTLESADVVVTTPEKWDGVSRHWAQRNYVQHVGLFIIDEIHLLGLDRGPILEVIVSRMRYISSHTDRPIRFVGLSTALANAHDIADWLGIGRVGLFNFRPSVRPVPCTVHISGFPENHYCPRMATMNKPAFQAIKSYSPNKPVLIFVSSRRQTRLTALDLIGLCVTDDCPKQFTKLTDEFDLQCILKDVSDETLKRTIEFGVGMHHAGLKERDRTICEELFLSGKIQILITTSTLAWGVNFPAHLVIIKGTEYYDGKKKKYVDMPITDVLQMMGRAGRPQFDKTAIACIFAHEPKKDYYKKFIYEPFPVESCLADHLQSHLNAEISTGTIKTRQEALDYITWTYLFRRLTANPAYYNVVMVDSDDEGQLEDLSFSLTKVKKTRVGRQTEEIARFVENLVDVTIKQLIDQNCIELKEVCTEFVDNETSLDIIQLNLKQKRKEFFTELVPTTLGMIASIYYVQPATVDLFYKKLSREAKASFIDLLKLICDCAEYAELPVRHNEDVTNASFAEMCPLKIDTSQTDSPHVKAFLLLQSHLFNIALPITDYVTDLKSVLDQSIRIIQACTDVASHLGQFTTVMNCCLLLQSITQGSHPYRNALYTLPYFNDIIIQQSSLNDIETIAQLIELSQEEQKTHLQRLFAASAQKVTPLLKILREMPKLRIEVYIEKKKNADVWLKAEKEEGQRSYLVESDCQLRLNVTLTHQTRVGEVAFAPKFSKRKTSGWWCLLGDNQTDELIGLKRVGQLRANTHGIQSANVSFTFTQMSTGDSNTTCRGFLSLLVLSDCYMSLDQQVDIQIIPEKRDDF